MEIPLNSINSLLASGKLLKTSPANSHSFTSSLNVNLSGLQAGNKQQTDSFEIFNNILQKTYKKMLFNPDKATTSTAAPPPTTQADISQYKTVDKISSQQAASTILNFITLRIELDQAEGADQDALLERLDQGLNGFIRGFNEAKQIIDDIGLLTPELLEQINDTYNLVIAGIEDQRLKIS